MLSPQLRMGKTKNLVSSSIVISERLLYTINQPLLALKGVWLRRKITIETFWYIILACWRRRGIFGLTLTQCDFLFLAASEGFAFMTRKK